jgi:hypothetical protein
MDDRRKRIRLCGGRRVAQRRVPLPGHRDRRAPERCVGLSDRMLEGKRRQQKDQARQSERPTMGG